MGSGAAGLPFFVYLYPYFFALDHNFLKLCHQYVFYACIFHPLKQKHQLVKTPSNCFQNDYLKTPRKLVDILWTAGILCISNVLYVTRPAEFINN